jgi:hypothetical protein
MVRNYVSCISSYSELLQAEHHVYHYSYTIPIQAD